MHRFSPDDIGKEFGPSQWTKFSQADIDGFGKNTRDIAPLHMDTEWVRKHSPFGRTIAYGFQTLSMLTYFHHQVFGWDGETPTDQGFPLNYGFDRVRFIEPVPVDTPFRCHFTLTSMDEPNAGEYRTCFKVEVEVEGSKKPALIADWVTYWVSEEGNQRLAAQ
ncbi:MAG: MaoC/PaaZ C-terminal domain-containing protein [Pseudomonadota bacterium]